MSPTEKIDAIYDMLVTADTRRKRGTYWIWIKRVCIYGLLVLIFLYPSVVYTAVSGGFSTLVYPIVQQAVDSAIQGQKANVTNTAIDTKDILLEKAREYMNR
jgi:hypothetical protein